MTHKQFALYLAGRRAKGECLQAIGASFGVSRQAVHQWLTGVARPSGTVLILADVLAGTGPAEWGELVDLSTDGG
jgi:hypothetical protein